jgi:dipeptidyl aminopeptidase/acylaminoacyl peptidase
MRRLCSAFLVLASLGVALADAPKRTHSITIDDYFTMATPVEVAVSPDGRYVAYTDARWQKASNDRKADLWFVTTKRGTTRRLTSDRVGARSIRWSSGGESLYYIGQHRRAGEKEPPYDGTPQVWRVGRSDGVSKAVTRVPKGVAAYQLDSKGMALYYLVNVAAEPAGPFARLKKETKDIDYGDGTSHEKSQVWKLDLRTWREEKILDDGRTVREMSLSPDGKRLALITTPDDTVVTFEGQSRVEVFDLAAKKSTVLPDKVYRADAPSKFAWLENVTFGPDNRLAFAAVFDGYPAEVIVGEDGEKGWSTRRVIRPEGTQVRGYGSPLAWGPKGVLYFLGEKKGYVRLCEANAAHPDSAATYSSLVGSADEVVLGAFSISAVAEAGPAAAAIVGTPTSLHEVCLLEAGKKPRPLTHLNPQADAWKLPTVKAVTWKGANGDDVEGVLELPADVKPGVPLPLVVAIHGGPTTSVPADLDFNPYEGRCFLSARGYAVLCPNYRGSTGNGDKFTTDLIGRENDIEVEDILKGVDAMVARKIADPDRLAVMGWSNGGYLTNCLIARTTRFKAASSGAGIVDTVMEWGSNDEPAYMNVLKGGLPWDKPEAYRRTSPLYQFNKITTPTLIHVGGNDVRCPPAHSRTLYRALKLYNKVPTELVTYKGEPHGLTKYANRKAKMEWDVAWFERYVQGKKE